MYSRTTDQFIQTVDEQFVPYFNTVGENSVQILFYYFFQTSNIF